MHDIERVYHAFIRGVMRPRAGTIDGNIGRNPRNRKKMAVLATGGKPARTHYTTCKTYADRASLVHCRLESGRTHQIRVHLSAYKHPILADALYGRVGTLNNTLATRWCMAGESEPLTQALHAAVLGFKHPISGKAMRFDSPPGRLFDFLDATLTQLV